MSELQHVQDQTAPFCKGCGARVHDPCNTDEKAATCQLPAFCFDDVVSREIVRIRRLFEPSNGGDREDLISYAKEVVRLRA